MEIAQLILEEDSDAAVVRGNMVGEFNAAGDVPVCSNGNVRLRPAVNDGNRQEPEAMPEIGDKMEDSTIYAGISPDTNKPMYALPADAPLVMMWKKAMMYAADFVGHGHPKGAFRVPTKGELNVLFQNRARIGGFSESESCWDARDWYWSSTEDHFSLACRWGQDFDTGFQSYHHKSGAGSVRLVRG
jgi:hypothetical protein